MNSFSTIMSPTCLVNRFFVIALGCLVLLQGCSKDDSFGATAETATANSKDGLAELVRQVESWECPAPDGGEHIRPLYYLKADDKAGIKEARERIELTRRQRNDSWKDAESGFRFVQLHFAMDFYNTREDKERALLGLRQAADGTPLFKGTPQEFVSGKKRSYDSACQGRTKVIEAMLADEPKLAALRREARQPWLLERNKIACFLAEIPNCEK